MYRTHEFERHSRVKFARMDRIYIKRERERENIGFEEIETQSKGWIKVLYSIEGCIETWMDEQRRGPSKMREKREDNEKP